MRKKLDWFNVAIWTILVAGSIAIWVGTFFAVRNLLGG